MFNVIKRLFKRHAKPTAERQSLSFSVREAILRQQRQDASAARIAVGNRQAPPAKAQSRAEGVRSRSPSPVASPDLSSALLIGALLADSNIAGTAPAPDFSGGGGQGGGGGASGSWDAPSAPSPSYETSSSSSYDSGSSSPSYDSGGSSSYDSGSSSSSDSGSSW